MTAAHWLLALGMVCNPWVWKGPELWEQMGGVPADLSTVEAFVRIGLTLWRKHKALMGAVDDLIGGDA